MNNNDLMQLAIEVMFESKIEVRDDNKISPKVGAVIVKKDGTVDKAHRGELRCGDHAEYTLLDRKNAERDLTGATMFVTLEPCAPGSRSCRKTCCAERIVNARIKTVYVACEDPDPKVARAGIDFLQNNKVEVIMFEKEYQDKVYSANIDFFKQAYERAEEAQKIKVLTQIDNFHQNIDLSILSKEAIDYYCHKSGVSQDNFINALTNLGLVNENKFNDQAILLFGRNPRDFFAQAGIKIVFNFGENSNYQELEGPLILISEKIKEWFSTLPMITNRENFNRTEKEIYPFEVLREAIINAIVHRDYDIEGAKITIVIDENKISVKSPGFPVKGISFDQIESFTAPSLSRNPKISYIFNKVKLMEESGLGMKTFKEVPSKYNLPLPIYTYDGVNLVLDLYFNEKTKNESILSSIDKQEIKNGYEFIVNSMGVTKEEYLHKFKISDSKAKRQLKEMVDHNLIVMVGKSINTKYIKK